MNLRSFALVGLLAATPALALDFGADSRKRYGGDYSPDCANRAAPRLRVLQHSLLLEVGGNRITGRNVQDAVSYFEPATPPNYLTTLLSDVPGGDQMLFVVYRDAAGQYIEPVAAGGKIEAALKQVLGKMEKAKFRDCAPETHPANIPAAAPAAPAENTWDPLRDEKFRAIYRKALGAKAKQPWLAEMNGPMPPVGEVSVAGTNYRNIAVCKPHDCHDHNLVLLYDPAKRVVYGHLHESGRVTLLGRPSSVLAKELERLWRAAWRQQ